MMDFVKVAKWGNSLAVRLPSKLVQSLGVKEGESVKIRSAASGELIVAKDDDREAALARIAARRWKAPDGFKFDRDKANER